MPKLLMINSVCTGSHGQIMRDLAHGARDCGYDVTVAFGRGAALDEKCIRIGDRGDVLRHVALTRLLDWHARGSKGATEALVRTVGELAPDLVHLHNVHGYYLHAQTLFTYLRDQNIPTVWTHHDCWALTGHCSHFERAHCLRWESGCFDCPLKHAYPASYGLDGSRENYAWKQAAFSSLPAAVNVSPSRWLDGIMDRSYLGKMPRQVIPNGIDLTLFSPIDRKEAAQVRLQHGIGREQALLLAVASPFDERKGFFDALQAARLAGEKARVMLVGLNEKQLKRLPPYVIGIAKTDSPQALVSLYGAADCLINFTYEDTYPTVNMEAMACGTPVACYGTGGAREQLQAPHAVAVPTGALQALLDAALSLAEQKAELTPLCREYAQKNFDRKQAVSAYIGLYQSMTGA